MDRKGLARPLRRICTHGNNSSTFCSARSIAPLKKLRANECTAPIRTSDSISNFNQYTYIFYVDLMQARISVIHCTGWLLYYHSEGYGCKRYLLEGNRILRRFDTGYFFNWRYNRKGLIPYENAQNEVFSYKDRMIRFRWNRSMICSY